MLTITDFILVLRQFYNHKTSPLSATIKSSKNNSGLDIMSELEAHTIQSWRELMNKQYSSFISIDPECTLYEGLYQLIKHKIHRLPIF